MCSAACNMHGVFVLLCTRNLCLRQPLREANGRKVLTSTTFCLQQQMREDSAAKISVWIQLLTLALVHATKNTDPRSRKEIWMQGNTAHTVLAHNGGAAPPHRRCSHGAPVTQSPDPGFSMVLGCHGSCFTNYPRGHDPTLCPHYLCAVCIVCEIIFQVCSQMRNSCTEDSHLTNPRTPRKYG